MSLTLGFCCLKARADGPSRLVVQYGEKIPFCGLPDASESIAKERGKMKCRYGSLQVGELQASVTRSAHVVDQESAMRLQQ